MGQVGVGGKNSRHKKGKVCQQREAVSPEGGLHRKLTPYKGTMRRGKRKKEESNACFQDSSHGDSQKERNSLRPGLPPLETKYLLWPQHGNTVDQHLAFKDLQKKNRALFVAPD